MSNKKYWEGKSWVQLKILQFSGNESQDQLPNFAQTFKENDNHQIITERIGFSQI